MRKWQFPAEWARMLLGGAAGMIAFAGPVLALLPNRLAPAAKAFDLSRAGAWLLCLLGLFLLFVFAGIQIRDRWAGALIDERNRFSLSRLQVSLWTSLILSGLYVVFIANVLRSDAKFDSLKIDLDPNLLMLMGLSIASFVSVPMVLNLKTVKPSSADALDKANSTLVDAQQLSSPIAAVGRLAVKRAPVDARFADLFRGEDVANSTTVDLPKAQMLIMTLVVVLAYGATVLSLLGRGDWLLDHLPKLSETVLLLVLISHGGYLGGKLMPSTGSPAGPSAELSSRALVASQRASVLATEVTAGLDRMSRDDTRRSSLEGQKLLAQVLATDAAKLPGRLAAADFKTDELAAVEGRIEALQTTVRMLTQGPGTTLDVPPPSIVSAVQARLASAGYAVKVSGTPDADTESAIQQWLAANGVSRVALHASRQRFYEELAHLV